MARTLWDALAEIEDGRGRKGRQYKLRSVLGIAIAAMLAGPTTCVLSTAGASVAARGVAPV